jgi:hypothetical protein
VKKLPKTRPDRNHSRIHALGRNVRQHPVISTILIGSTLLGAVLGAFLLTGEWSLARRIAGGAVAGAGTGMLITMTKMLD